MEYDWGQLEKLGEDRNAWQHHVGSLCPRMPIQRHWFDWLIGYLFRFRRIGTSQSGIFSACFSFIKNFWYHSKPIHHQCYSVKVQLTFILDLVTVDCRIRGKFKFDVICPSYYSTCALSSFGCSGTVGRLPLGGRRRFARSCKSTNYGLFGLVLDTWSVFCHRLRLSCRLTVRIAYCDWPVVICRGLI